MPNDSDQLNKDQTQDHTFDTAFTDIEPIIEQSASRPRLVGEVLISEGHLTEDQLEQALTEQRTSGKKLGEILVSAGTVSESVLLHSLARCLGVKGVRLRHGLIDPQLITLINPEECERLLVLPMFRVHGKLTVAMAEPQNLPLVDQLAARTGLQINPVLAFERNILEYVRKYSAGDVDINEFLTTLSETDVEVVEREAVDEDPTTDLSQMVEGSPIVNLVNVAMLTAVKDGASDIHIEPDKGGTRIRYRIDGSLRELMHSPMGMHSAIVSRVKIIGKMDISEKRLPQEGRVRIIADGREIDLRVSSLPTLLGEKLVIRVLDKENLNVRMEELGFRPELLERFKKTLKLPHGMLLVTGPTGSGKTTTLYSALDLLRSPETNIVTVEDPVEYQLDMVNQVQVHDGIGLDFARTLRSILRQDPDVIMIGEIRDEETATVAIQASLTGHSMLATLHTNDAPGAISRMTDMNVEPYLLSAALNGVVAQRLARTICPSCSTSYFPSEQVLEDAGLSHMAGRPFRKGAGCPNCHDTGCKGRMGIYEFMEVTPEIRRLIYAGAAKHEIRNLLKTQNQLSLREEGVKLAIAHHTSLEEILSVTKVDDVNDEPDTNRSAA
ncbi:MAG: Flp pilus assembly complex ATPase component TadA [Phycisphaerales bacterium]|nr:Flp pilus assembly complex ATPase component TadA [Phycisphaerales bacterium]